MPYHGNTASLELQYQAFDPKLFRGRSAIPKRGIRDIYRQGDLQLTILSTTVTSQPGNM